MTGKGEGMKKRETRFVPTEIRAIETDDGELVLEGYAALFDSRSANLGGFVETIRPGAFRKTLEEKPDIRALWNHNSDYVLGRTKSGSLELEEDEIGLRVRIAMPDGSQTRYFHDTIRRGDVDGMSFGFRTIKDSWDKPGDGSTPTRELVEIELFEVSPTAFPAYPETGGKLNVRDYLASIGEREERIDEIVAELSDSTDDEPAQDGHSDDTDTDDEARTAEAKARMYALRARAILNGKE